MPIRKSKVTRKQNIGKINENEKKYRTIFELSPAAIVLLDEKGCVVDVNGRLYDWLGYKPEEVIGKPLRELPYLTPKSKKEVTKRFLDRIRGRKVSPYELDFVAKNGKPVIGRISATIIFDENKKKSMDLVVIEDITEKSLADEIIRESEARYRTIFENSGAATIIIGEDLTILMANTEFERFSGFKKEEIVGKKSILDFVESEYINAIKGYHKLRLVDPQAVPRNYEIKGTDKYGRVRDIYLTVAIIPGTKQSVVSFLDISELRKKEIELKKQKELLNSANSVLEKKVKELQDASKHIKRLEGLVPICANCKKMRMENKDPKDHGAWIPLEQYISERSDASFTHGLCPECMDKLYRNKSNKGKSKK